MAAPDRGDSSWPYTRLTAALLFSTLLFIPIVLAGLPGVSRNAITGLFTRGEVLLIFFIATPIVFTAFAAYRVAQFYRVIGEPNAK